MREPEATEHLANHVSQLAVGLGARRTWRELGLDGGPVHTVHRGIEVRIPDDGPGSVERLAALGCLSGGYRGDHAGNGQRSQESLRANVHLMSALICAGTANTDGSTLPYSTPVMARIISVLITLTFVVAGWSRLPNFL